MIELATNPEGEIEDFSDELSDEALDRLGTRACVCCTCSNG
jgi:hypothetical protein